MHLSARTTRDQHTEAQHDALLAAGVAEKNIYVEKASTRLTLRPQLAAVRKVMRAGDTLVCTKVDRLARSLLDLITIADELRAEGIKLEFLTGTFNRDDPMGEAFFQMTGVFAQLERDLIRQRTYEGLAAARARGRVGGRKAKLTKAQAEQVRKLYAAKEMTVAEIGALFGISRESVYRYVKGATHEHARHVPYPEAEAVVRGQGQDLAGRRRRSLLHGARRRAGDLCLRSADRHRLPVPRTAVGS